MAWRRLPVLGRTCHPPGGATQRDKNPGQVVGPVQAATPRSERVLEALVQALDKAVALGGVCSGGDVFHADGGAEGAPDGTAELRASVGSDGCWDPEPRNPGGDEGSRTVICGSRGQRHRFHPSGGSIYYSKKIAAAAELGARH